MNKALKIMGALALGCMSAAGLGAAPVAPTSLAQRLDAMQKTLEAMQSQLVVQQQQIAAQQAALEALRTQQAEQQQPAIDRLEQANTQSRLAAQEQPKISYPGSRLTVSSFDGRSSITVRGVAQVDMAHYSQSPTGPLSSDFRRGSVGATSNRENDAARDLSDGAYFRRARFGFEGVTARVFSYKLSVELGGAGTEGPTRINDAWIGYTGFAPFTLQIGAFAPLANLGDSTAVEDQLLIERASSAELSRALGGADSRLGIGLRASGARWMSALSLTGRTVSDPEVFDAQKAAVGRFGFLAATGADYNVHLGVNGTYVFHPPDQGPSVGNGRYAIRFRERPELRVDSTRLIDTGPIDADHAYNAGLEFAANRRNWLLQSEYTWFGITRRASTLDNPRFSGYYIEGSWLITGESHRYNPATASYQAPRPFIPFDGQGGWGAWELALRYSHTDLDYHSGVAGAAPPAGGVRGGVQSIATAGVNWYPNANLRFILEMLHVNVDRLNPAGTNTNTTPFGPPPATPPVGSQIGQEFNAYALRSQFIF